MKTKTSITIVFLLFMFSFSYAQPPQGGGQQGGRPGPPPVPNAKQIEQMVNSLAQEIALSDNQESAILDLYNEHFKQVKQKQSGNTPPKKEEMEALNTDLEKQVKAVLTTDQISKYETYLKN